VAKAGMEDWVEGLSSVTFHAKLGSQAERVGRIAALAREIAPHVGADADKAEEAARIAKADLRSEMVGEFPELQGVMGRYYALEAGRDTDVADACRDHWKPLGQDDEVPNAPISVAVALADKLDTLTGFWAIDEKPTGSKDPYALRRAALGAIRLILGNELKLRLDRFIDAQLLRHKIELNRTGASEDEIDTLEEILEEIGDHGVFGAAFRAVKDRRKTDGELVQDMGERVPDISRDLLRFFHDRLKVHLRDEGIRHDVIDACLASEANDELRLVTRRAEALGAFLKTEDGENLKQGFRRASNILTQAEEKDGVEYSFGADVKFAETDEERALFEALDAAEGKIGAALKCEDYPAAMTAMASLRAPVDAFFEAVQINTESEVLRRNRLNLLSRIRGVCSGVADLNRLEG